MALNLAAKGLRTTSVRFASIATASRDDGRKMLNVTFENGESGKYPYVWLRDNCPAPHSYHITPESKARLVKMHQIDLDVQPVKVATTPSGVDITWPGDKSATYTSNWLANRNLSGAGVRKNRNDLFLQHQKIWDRKTYQEHFRFHDFEKCLADDQTFHDALTDLTEYGLIFFDNIPAESGQQLRLSKFLGFHYKTHYGDNFDVVYKPVPTNVGNNTSEELELHTDHPYQEVPPDVQMLHCIKNFGSVDGESVFSDGLNAARTIKRDHLDLFKLLCDVPLEYIDEGVDFIPFDSAAKFPVFNFNSDGQLYRVVFSNHMRSWFLNLEPEQVQTFYRAIKLFRDTVHDEQNCFKIQLRPGQMVAFDNNRVMHGRTKFTVTPETQRHLQGIFFSWDCIKSRIRVLRDRLGIEPNPTAITKD